jgi:hypothetical protein
LGQCVLTGCNLCKEEVLSDVASPDGKWTATTIIWDCGATTSEVVTVNIHPIGNNGFKADTNALVMKHGPSPSVVWKDKEHLIIDCADCAKDEVTRRSQMGQIRIEYNIR